MSINDLDIYLIKNTQPARNLYFLRQYSTELYNMITVEDVYKRAIDTIHAKLNNDLGEKYQKFINMIDKYGMTLVGKYITQCILGETWNADILVKIKENYYVRRRMTNVFASLGKLVKNVQINWSPRCFKIHHVTVYNGDSRINIYYFYADLTQIYSICKNMLTMDEKISKLAISDINKLISKEMSFGISDKYLGKINMCKELGFNCRLKFDCDYVHYRYGMFDNLLVYRDDGMFMSHGKQFMTNKIGRISHDPVPIIGSRYDLVYVDVALKEFTKECIFDGCLIGPKCDDENNIYCGFYHLNNIRHFHSCEYFVKGGQQYMAKIIVVKYEDIEYFSYFPKQFDGVDSMCSINESRTLETRYPINLNTVVDADKYMSEIMMIYGNDTSGFRPELV